MVSVQTRRDEQIERFIDSLREHIVVEKAILFGSHVYGTPHEWSDIDLVIISPDFGGEHMIDRLKFLYRMAWDAGANWIEPLGYTPEEFESAGPLSFLGEVEERGVVIYDKESELEFSEESVVEK